MTLPTSDARSAQSLPTASSTSAQLHKNASSYSIPEAAVSPSPSSATTQMVTSPQGKPGAQGYAPRTVSEHAIDFATNSWDLATGGLKTLTAKRELPIRPERHLTEVTTDAPALSLRTRTSLTRLFLVCVLLMLIGGAIVIFVMLQP